MAVKCEECGKVTKNKQTLKFHLETHLKKTEKVKPKDVKVKEPVKTAEPTVATPKKTKERDPFNWRD